MKPYRYTDSEPRLPYYQLAYVNNVKIELAQQTYDNLWVVGVVNEHYKAFENLTAARQAFNDIVDGGDIMSILDWTTL